MVRPRHLYLRLIRNYPTNTQVELNPRLVKSLTEYSYFLNGIFIIFYKMSLAIKKGSGLCYLEVDLNQMN